MKEGDKCTKIFHRGANSHKRNNTIEMRVDGAVPSNPIEIEEHIVQYYRFLLSNLHGEQSLMGLGFGTLNQQGAEWLERPWRETVTLAR